MGMSAPVYHRRGEGRHSLGQLLAEDSCAAESHTHCRPQAFGRPAVPQQRCQDRCDSTCGRACSVILALSLAARGQQALNSKSSEALAMSVAHACAVQRLPLSLGRRLHPPPMEWPVSITGQPGKRSAAACSAA